MSSRPKPPKVSLPALVSGPVPLVGIRDQARKQLLEIIATVGGGCSPATSSWGAQPEWRDEHHACMHSQRRGRKALILDPSISGPISLLDSSLTELLTEHGVAKCVGVSPFECIMNS